MVGKRVKHSLGRGAAAFIAAILVAASILGAAAADTGNGTGNGTQAVNETIPGNETDAGNETNASASGNATNDTVAGNDTGAGNATGAANDTNGSTSGNATNESATPVNATNETTSSGNATNESVTSANATNETTSPENGTGETAVANATNETNTTAPRGIRLMGPLRNGSDPITDSEGNSYATVAAAIAAASVGESIELTIRGEITENISLSKNIDLVIRGEDAVINGQVWMNCDGSLTLGDGSGAIQVNGRVRAEKGTLIIDKDVKVDVTGSTDRALTITGASTTGIIKGGSFTSVSDTVEITQQAKASFQNATFTSSNGTGFYASTGAKISEVTDCDITGKSYGLRVEGSSLNTRIETISGGSVTSLSTSGSMNPVYAGIYVTITGSNAVGTASIGLLKDCTVTASNTYQYGGAIALIQSSNATADKYDQVRIEQIENCTLLATGGGSGIAGQCAHVGLVKNTIATASAGGGSGINTFKCNVDGVDGGKFVAEGTGTGMTFSSGTVGDIKNAELTGARDTLYVLGATIGNVDSCTLNQTAVPDSANTTRRGALQNEGTVGNITNCTINAQRSGIVSAYQRNVGIIKDTVINAAEGYGILGYGGVIQEIDNCTINAMAQSSYGRGIRVYQQGSVPGGIHDCDIKAGTIAIDITSSGSTSGTGVGSSAAFIRDNTVSVLGSASGSGYGILLQGGQVGDITGNTVTSAPVGISNFGAVTEISGNNITAGTTGIEIDGRGVALGYIYFPATVEKMKDNTVTCENGPALSITPDSTVKTLDGGVYVGGTNGITDRAKLGTITGSPVIWGKNGYAIGNADATQATDLEPTLTTELKGYGRYLGSSGLFASEDTVNLPTHTPSGMTYHISARTENVASQGQSMYYLTLNVKLSYDSNEGSGEMEPYEGEYSESYAVKESGFEREGHRFIGWNTAADGSGRSYQPGETFEFTQREETLYAQWQAPVTLSFDPNGGILEGSSAVVEKKAYPGTTFVILDAPTREGYNFLYWKGSEYQPGNEYPVAEDHTFIAQWEVVSEDENETNTTDDNTTDDNTTDENSTDPEKNETKPDPKPQPQPQPPVDDGGSDPAPSAPAQVAPVPTAQAPELTVITPVNPALATGDSANVPLWAGVSGLSLVGLILVIVMIVRRRR